MYKIERGPEPDVLKEKGREWTDRLLDKLETSGKPISKIFSWPQYRNRPLNHILQDALLEMTAQHCAFCDGVFEQSPVTVEHFRPKSKYPELAYDWPNLFPCCTLCQEKGDDYDEKLLKPDEVNYDFDRYFICNYSDGTIQPNPAASAEDRARAKMTIELYNLNEGARNKGRERAYKFYKYACEHEDSPLLDDYNYRYYINILDTIHAG